MGRTCDTAMVEQSCVSKDEINVVHLERPARKCTRIWKKMVVDIVEKIVLTYL